MRLFYEDLIKYNSVAKSIPVALGNSTWNPRYPVRPKKHGCLVSVTWPTLKIRGKKCRHISLIRSFLKKMNRKVPNLKRNWVSFSSKLKKKTEKRYTEVIHWDWQLPFAVSIDPSSESLSMISLRGSWTSSTDTAYSK